MTEVLNSARETERVSASDPISTSMLKGHARVWMSFGAKGWMQAASHRKSPGWDGSISTSGCTAESPTQVGIQRKFKNKHSHKHTHILSMFSQCQYCNVSTLIMKMHWGFSSSLKRRIWRQSWRADKDQAYLQNKFWHICLDIQLSGRKVPSPWMKYLQSAELFHPQLYIQVSPGTLNWDVESPDLFWKERRTPDYQST